MSITPAEYPLVPKVRKDTILSLLDEGKRIDGRKLDEVRSIEITIGYVEKADGSALVNLGDTKVLTGVKLEVGTPYSDTPDEGVLMVNAEFVPLASPFFEPGPPDENAYELARVIDRSYRETSAIDLKSLAILPGQKVFVVWNDIYVLNHAGNLIDASALASMAALLSTRVPKYEVNDSQVTIMRGDYERSLPVKKVVVTATVAKIGSHILVDPTDEEESVADARLAVSFLRDGTIAGMQKMGPGYLKTEELETAIDMAWKAAQKYFEELEKACLKYGIKLPEREE